MASSKLQTPLRDEVEGRTLTIPTARIYAPLLTKRRFRGARGGRGSAKSMTMGGMLVEDMVCEHVRAVCGREVQDSIRDSSKQVLEDIISQHGLERYFRITDREIICPSTESLAIFRGLQNHTARTIKSLQGFNRFWGDEAQAFSERSLELLVPTFRSGSVLDFSWNPENHRPEIGRYDPIQKLFDDAGCEANKPCADPDFVLVEANYYDNPWFPDELRRDMERMRARDPLRYAHIWLGKPRRIKDAIVFQNWRVEDFATPADAVFFLGADWGFANDPTVLVRCFIIGRTLYVDRELYAVGVEIDHTPAFFDTLDPANPGMARKWPITADSARPETISYMRRFGYPRIKPAIKGAGSVDEGVEFLKSFDIVIHPRCRHTINEMCEYSYKTDKNDNVLPILADKKNQVIDSLRYALEGTRRSTYSLDAVG